MGIFKQKWLKTRMDIALRQFIACSVGISKGPLRFALGVGAYCATGLVATFVHAQTPPPPVDPQPPRIVDTPPAARPSPRPATPPPTPAAKPTPAQTLEQSLTPELKPMPADPTERVIENTRRLMQQRQNRANQSGGDVQQAGRVVVEGAAPITPEAGTSERVGNILNPNGEAVISTPLPGGMARQECVAECVGPACCIIVETVPPQHKQNPLR
jgi:hypothetical protein